jgi:hypothetical protein
MPIKLANNASGTLATAISASDTGAVLTTGDGAEFPVLTAGDYFYATLTSTQGTQEIVKATARSGDSLTIVRAQEGTTAQSFAAGARFELRVTVQSVLDAIQDSEKDTTATTASGTGSQVAFSVTNGFTAIYINGVYQNRNTYTVTSGTVTFSAAPPLNSIIEVVYN